MSLLVPNSSEVVLLGYLLSKTTAKSPVIRLYTNDRTPAESDGINAYTEATDVAYSSVVLTGSAWTIATASGTTSGTFQEQTFSFSSSTSCYGYFITAEGDSTTLLWAERFTGAPFSIPSGGGSIAITPTIELA